MSWIKWNTLCLERENEGLVVRGLGDLRSLIYHYLRSGFEGCWRRGRVCDTKYCVRGMVTKEGGYVLEGG